MKINFQTGNRREDGAILAYFILLVVALVGIASVSAYVTQTTTLARRRSNMASAYQFSVAGALIAANDLNNAVLTNNGNIGNGLKAMATPYTQDTTLSTSAQKVFTRTITSPFTNQSVTAQIWLPNVSSPTSAKIVSTTKVGSVSQTSTLNVKMSWAYPAAIISVNNGTSETSVSKSVAQNGNVVVNGDKNGVIVVDGGPGLAVLANGRIDMDTNYVSTSSSSYSQTNYGGPNQIPDYTTQGTSNTLFDINRFVSVADHTTNGPSRSKNNHFTNIAEFAKAAESYPNSATAMEGIVVVDVWGTDKNLSAFDKGTGSDYDSKGKAISGTSFDISNNGINVRGTLLFNFLGSGWDPTSSKIIVSVPLNVNAADLSHLVATSPATYTNAYPPVYSDPSKNPTNANIVPYGYQNFAKDDDLPALLYSIGVVDIHGPVDICGVVYTPSYIELENKSAVTQYIKGSVIMGNGIYYENTTSGAKSIISFDPNTLDSLSTLNGAGKQVRVAYWQ